MFIKLKKYKNHVNIIKSWHCCCFFSANSAVCIDHNKRGSVTETHTINRAEKTDGEFVGLFWLEKLVYLPCPNPWPVPVADCPKRVLRADPWPVAMPMPPFWALATPAPTEETPPGPAWPLPIPEPVPLAGLTTAHPLTTQSIG